MKTTINNEFLALTVDTHGAEMVSLKNAAGEELIWQGDPALWNRHAPVLFPWTGRLTGGEFSYKGRTYKGGQHGFARDLEHELVSVSEGSIVFELRAGEDTAERFPFDFTLRSEYKLDGKKLHHSLTVVNNGKENMPFGIGYHPAFNVPFDDKHDTEDYEFRFEREESPLVIDCRPNGLLSGKSYYVWKNADRIQLTDRLFDNDSFCMAGVRSKTLGIYEKDSGRHISCTIEGYPYTLIWSALSEKIRFVCIEPWHSLPGAETDSTEWTERAAAAVLKSGESFETVLTMEFER